MVASAKVVDASLRDIENGHVDGVAAITKAARRQVVEEGCMRRILGTHGERLTEDARPGMNVHQRVVRGATAGLLHNVSAELKGLMGNIPAYDFFLGLWWWCWRWCRLGTRRDADHDDNDNCDHLSQTVPKDIGAEP